MARNFTDKGVAALKPRAKLYAHPDPQLPGHYIRVMPTGSKSFVVVARDLRGKQIWSTLGKASDMGIESAREEARKVMGRIKAGQDKSGPVDFETASEQWLKRHVEAKGLRSDYEYRRMLRKHVLPVWGNRELEGIRRGDVALLQDQVEDEAGLRTSDKVLSLVSTIFQWHEMRNENYVSPVRRGMKRYSSREHARARILTDDEIRAAWSIPGAYGDIIKLCMLTGQRRQKVASMRWADVKDGVWSIPTEAREKNNAGELKLPPQALEIIERQPRLNLFVFAGRGDSHFKAWKHRDSLNGGWHLHDLRRTARSLISRAGVRPDIAERVLGHAIKGVEATYDRYSYFEEKAHALAALASLIENVLQPPTKKVVRLAKRG